MPGARSKFHLKDDIGKVYFLNDVSGETLVFSVRESHAGVVFGLATSCEEFGGRPY